MNITSISDLLSLSFKISNTTRIKIERADENQLTIVLSDDTLDNNYTITNSFVQSVSVSVDRFITKSNELYEDNEQFGKLFMNYGKGRLLAHIADVCLTANVDGGKDSHILGEMKSFIDIFTPERVELIDARFAKIRDRIKQYDLENRVMNKLNAHETQSIDDYIGFHLEAMHYLIKGSILILGKDRAHDLLNLFNNGVDEKIASGKQTYEYLTGRFPNVRIFENFMGVINLYGSLLKYITRISGIRFTDSISKLVDRTRTYAINSMSISNDLLRIFADSYNSDQYSDLVLSQILANGNNFMSTNHYLSDDGKYWLETSLELGHKIVMNWVKCDLYNMRKDKVVYSRYIPNKYNLVNPILKRNLFIENSKNHLIKALEENDYTKLLTGVQGSVDDLITDNKISAENYDVVVNHTMALRLLISNDSPLRDSEYFMDKYETLEPIIESAVEYLENVLHTMVILWFYSNNTFMIEYRGTISHRDLYAITKRQIFISLIKYYESIKYVEYLNSNSMDSKFNLEQAKKVTNATNIVTFYEIDSLDIITKIESYNENLFSSAKLSSDVFFSLIKQINDRTFPLALLPFLLETNPSLSYEVIESKIDHTKIMEFIKAIERAEVGDEINDFQRDSSMQHFIERHDTEINQLMIKHKDYVDSFKGTYPVEYFVIRNFLLTSSIIRRKKKVSNNLVTFGNAIVNGSNILTNILTVLNNIIAKSGDKLSLLAQHFKSINE